MKANFSNFKQASNISLHYLPVVIRCGCIFLTRVCRLGIRLMQRSFDSQEQTNNPISKLALITLYALVSQPDGWSTINTVLSNTNGSGVARGHHGILTAHCTLLIRSAIVGITHLVAGRRITNIRLGHISGTQHATVTSGSKVSGVTDYKMAQAVILILNIRWPILIKWKLPLSWLGQ